VRFMGAMLRFARGGVNTGLLVWLRATRKKGHGAALTNIAALYNWTVSVHILGYYEPPSAVERRDPAGGCAQTTQEEAP